MSKSKNPDVATVQKLLNQLSYEDFMVMIAVIADQHPLGGIKQVQALPGGKQCVIYAKAFNSMDEALELIGRIEGVNL